MTEDASTATTVRLTPAEHRALIRARLAEVGLEAMIDNMSDDDATAIREFQETAARVLRPLVQYRRDLCSVTPECDADEQLPGWMKMILG